MEKKACNIFNNKLENRERKFRKVNKFIPNLNDQNYNKDTHKLLKNESIKNSALLFISQKIIKNHDDFSVKPSFNDIIKSNTFKISDYSNKNDSYTIKNSININTKSHKNNSFSRYIIDNYNRNESDDIEEILKEKILNLMDNTK